MDKETLKEFLERQLEGTKSRGEVLMFTIKIDGLREDYNFTVLREGAGRIGDFRLE